MGALLTGGPGTSPAAAARRGGEPAERRIPADDPVPAAVPRKIIREFMRVYPNYSLFLDPDPHVITKEFAFYYNTVLDTVGHPGRMRGLFHLIYQRSAGPQQSETLFGHAWSSDLRVWSVDTAAFGVDPTWWNSQHVWSPTLIHHGQKDYLFYTGVDSAGDQRIGYASTDLLDSTDTVWDPRRVLVLQASDTRWAVPKPWTYSGYTQFRDPFVMDDPDHPGRLLLYYNAHDSVDFAAGRGGLAVGVARSEPGTVDVWKDLGYFPSTLPSVTHVGQLEGPHLVPIPGTHTGYRLLFSNAGTPPGETGQTTIRFESLTPGTSVADTTSGDWSAPVVLSQYLNDDLTVFGWSGSEHLSVGDAEYLAGFTAWGPVFEAIAISRMHWVGGDFTLGGSAVTAVDEYRSPAKDVRLEVLDAEAPGRRATFAIDTPLALDARLEMFDAMGRRTRTLLDGHVPAGRSTVSWDLRAADGAPAASGMYFVRLSFPGGLRVARLPLLR